MASLSQASNSRKRRFAKSPTAREEHWPTFGQTPQRFTIGRRIHAALLAPTRQLPNEFGFQLRLGWISQRRSMKSARRNSNRYVAKHGTVLTSECDPYRLSESRLIALQRPNDARPFDIDRAVRITAYHSQRSFLLESREVVPTKTFHFDCAGAGSLDAGALVSSQRFW